MIRFWILAIGSLSFIASLAAHDVQKNTTSSGTLTFTVLANQPSIAIISDSGEVSIDWKATEKTVAEAKTDATTLAIARLMLAVRDGTWKPLR